MKDLQENQGTDVSELRKLLREDLRAEIGLEKENGQVYAFRFTK